MHPCYEYIEQIYQDKRINEYISKIKPVELQEDLKQEMAIVLLSYDCEKIKRMYNEGSLIAFTIGTIRKMGTLTKGYFYKTYKRNDINKAIEYLSTLTESPSITAQVKAAKILLDKKLTLDANQAHEAIIFEKYIELRSCKKVADFFGIPHLHVFKVVKKTKEELKKEINKYL